MSLIKFSNPKTKWAKERIKQHGETMELLNTMIIDGVQKVNVKSLEKTWSFKPGVKDFWVAWFSKKDSDFEIII